MTLRATDHLVKGVLKIVGMIVAMAILLAIFTDYDQSGDSRTVVLGLPVVSVKQVGAHGWLAMGQAGTGVLVIAQAGAGIVAFTQVGAGALFGIGQGMISLVALAQMGVGVFAFVGQVGLGAQAVGQGVAWTKPPGYFDELDKEVNELLSFRGV